MFLQCNTCSISRGSRAMPTPFFFSRTPVTEKFLFQILVPMDINFVSSFINNIAHSNILIKGTLACAFLRSPNNGCVKVSSYHPGGTASYSCDTGYVLRGVSRFTCRSAAWVPNWNGSPPSCSRKFFSLRKLFKFIF